MTAAEKPTKTAAAAAPASTPAKAPRKARVAVDRTNESPTARFRRVAQPRVKRALATLRRIETTARSSAYEFTPDQANAVMKYLDEAVDKVRTAFVTRVNRKPEENVTF